MPANKYVVSFGVDENVLKLGCGDGCININIIKFPELLKRSQQDIFRYLK